MYESENWSSSFHESVASNYLFPEPLNPLSLLNGNLGLPNTNPLTIPLSNLLKEIAILKEPSINPIEVNNFQTSSVTGLVGLSLNDPLTGVKTSNLTEKGLIEGLSAAIDTLGQLKNDSTKLAHLQAAFGNNWNPQTGQNLISDLINSGGELKIEILPGSLLNAKGAFSIQTKTIYLSQEFLSQNIEHPELITDVFLEEIGHYLDSKINLHDSPGDEGEIFAALAEGKNLLEDELLALKNQDDHTTLTLNGQLISIENAGQADLVVNSINTAATAALQETISVTWGVINQGTEATTSGWYDTFYLSNDTIYDSSDTYINDFYNSVTLAAGATNSKTQSLKIPNTALGSRYLLLVTDRYNYQSETNETNNTYAVPITLTAPDLTVTAASAPTTGIVASTVQATWTVKNQGSVTANADWYDYVYLSDNAVYDSSDRSLNYYYINTPTPLAAGDSYSQTQTVNLPGDAHLGSQYLLFVADRDNYQGETNEINNVYSVPITLYAPDLSITSASVPTTGTVGSTIPVSWTVSNQSPYTADANWYDYVYLSDNTIYDNSDRSLNYFYINSQTPLAAGNNYTQTQNITLPGNAPTGQQYLLFVADRDNYQGETDETNNVYSVPITLNAPDLTITTAAAPISADVGTNASVSWTVTNQSNVSAAADWYDYIYLSDDTTLDNNDTSVNYFSAASKTPLVAGASYTQTQNINIPAQSKPGNRYLLFVADRDKQQNETDESNNTYAVPITINGADLNVTGATVSQTANLAPGASVSVNWTVANQSSISATADWYDYVYFSNDANLDNSDSYLTYQWAGAKTPLAAGSNYTLSSNITLPTYNALGQRYLLFVTDRDNNQGETNEANNVYAVPISFTGSGPDLTITSATAPQNAALNESIAVNWNVVNQGQATSDYYWFDYFYLSDDSVLDNKDTYIDYEYLGDDLNYQALAAGGSYNLTRNIAIPNNSGLGNRYLLVVSDGGRNQIELNESNNVYAIPITLIAPDLTVSNLSAPQNLTVNAPTTVTWTVNNPSQVTAPATYWYDTFYLSDDPIYDNTDTYITDFGTGTNTPLAANSSYTQTQTLTIPNSRLGSHYLLVVADRGNYQGESNETNNVYAIPVNVSAPDLTVTAASAPVSGALGNNIGISWTVTNTGQSVAATDWYDYVYLSSNPTYDSSDTNLSYYYTGSSTPLDPSSSYTQTQNLTLPNNAPSGNLYLLFVADRDNYQGETDENNNVYAVPITINSPDLTVTAASVTPSTNVTPGSAASVSWTVTNPSTLDANGSWYDYIYLSGDSVYDDTDSYISYVYHNNLSAGASYTENQTINLPSNAVGQRYLLFVADRDHYQGESNENNNVYAVPITFNGTGSDFNVTSATAPSTGIVGDSILVNWNVSNIGAQTTSNTYWYDYIYLSKDTIYDNSDTYLTNQYSGYFNNYQALAAGASYNASTTIYFSNDLTIGDYYLLFVADRNNYENEINEANNVYSVPFTLKAPDLEITNATAPVTALPTEQIQVSWTVKNTGNAVAADDWYDNIYLSTDATFDNNDQQLKQIYTNYLSPLQINNQYSISQWLSLPNVATGSYYLLFVADAYNYQGESNNNNNTYSLPIALGSQQPDLNITAATAPATAIVGDTINLNWTVSNSGTSNAPADWIDTVYLSQDNIFDSNDTAIYSQSAAAISPLAAGGTYSFNPNVTLPNFPLGNRYLIFVTDSQFEQPEGNENNNIRIVPIELKAPDLTVTAATTSASATWGQEINVSWTVANQGNITAPANWFDYLYLSNDTVLDTNDLSIGSINIDAQTPLASNSSYTQSLNVTIPNQIGRVGNQYLLIASDGGNNQGETDETNNIYSIPILLQAPNLVVSAVTAPTSVALGENINLSWSVNNQGTGAALNDWYDYIYLSSDTVLDNNDRYLTNRWAGDDTPLAAGASYNGTQTVTIPSVTPGNYYLLFAADRNNNQAETNENDNIYATAISLEAPDLRVKQVTGPNSGYWAENISLGWTVENIGTAQAPTDWYDSVYLSTDQTFNASTDTYLGEFWTGDQTPLAAGSNYTFTKNFSVPTLAAGSYYLLFITDRYNYQAETDETNNIYAKPFTVQPPADLIATITNAPTTVTWGDTPSISWTVTNTGQGNAVADWEDRLYLSTDANLDSNDVFLNSISAANQTPLLAGGSYTLSSSVTIPNLTPGNYYLLLAPDYNGQQPESNETNNLAVAPLQIAAPPHADLLVEAVSTPSTALSGDAIQVLWRVRNQGNAVTNSNSWTDRVILSSDDQLDNNDLELGRLNHSDTLAIGDSYTQSASYTLPNGISGNYHIFVVTDINNQVFEYIYDNNNTSRTVSPLAVTRKPDPDLKVSAVTNEATGQPGQTQTVSWTVSNAGVAPAVGGWVDRIYLSPDGSLNGATLLSSVTRNADLAVGENYTVSQSVLLPLVSDGTYKIIVVTDANNTLFEGTGDTNNLTVGANSLQIGHPDLTPTITSAPSNATSGTTIPFAWTVQNIGSAATLTNWKDKIYLSSDTSYDGRDILLKEIIRNTSLAAQDSYSSQINLDLPIDVSGNRYLLLVTDAEANINEGGAENNNLAQSALAITLAPYADLAVSNVTAPELTIGDPASVTIGWKVSNNGTGAGRVNTWEDRIIASRDAIVGNGDDIILKQFTHSGALEVGANYTRSETFALPPAFTGQYQLFVQTDATNQVFENGLESNNSAAAANPFGVMPIPYSDLIVDSVNAPVSGNSGQAATVSWTVKNQGIGTTSSNSWSETLSLATDAAGQNIIANLGSFEHIGSLAVGGSYSRSAEVTLPNGLSGQYYFVVSTGGPFEFIYDNNNQKVSNVTAVTLSNSPDLTVTNITAPPAMLAGEKADITWTVNNSGIGDAAGTWTDQIYLRAAGNPNSQLISLGSYTYGSGLQAGKSYTRSEQITLPSTLQGLYEVVITTNATSTLYEHGPQAKGNNTTVDDATLLLSLPPRPDLRVESIIAPDTVSAGGTVSLEFVVKNYGTVITTTPNWLDRVYLSLDNQISGDDLSLGDFNNASALDAGESYRTTANTLVIPRRFRGQVYLIVQTDAGGQVNEYPQEDNNILTKALYVNPLPPADLVTSNVTAPDQAFEGSQIEVRYTVTNKGIGETDRDGWTDTIWLTRDKNRPSPVAQGTPPQPDDILLTTIGHNGSLKVGESYGQTATVTLPSQITGQWYITPWSDAYDVITEDTLDINSNPDDPNQLDSNNYKSRPITVLLTPPPDLVVTSVTPTATATGGGLFNVNWTVKNQGANETTGNTWSDTVYLSDSPTLNTPGGKYWQLGTVQHTGTLGVGQTYTGQLSTQLTPGAFGQYVIVKTNSGFEPTWEGPYNNNNERSAATNVTNAPADLIVSSVVTTPNNFSGERTTVKWTVTNTGAPTWEGTRYWYDEVWLSPDSTFIPSRAQKVGFFLHSQTGPLTTGESYTQTQDITLPAGIDGNYYVYVSTDYSYDYNTARFSGEIPRYGGDNTSSRESFEYRVFEDTSNNLNSAALAVTYREPDLQISNLTTPQTPQLSGQTVDLSWTVTNSGTRDTRQNSWIDRVYLSRDPSLDLADVFLGEYTRRGLLAAGSSYTQNAQVTLPDGISGDFYLLVFTDSNVYEYKRGNLNLNFEGDQKFARVPEFKDEGNNISSNALRINLQPPADLKVTTLTIPERAKVGQSFNLSYTVTNTGVGDTPPRQNSWQDLIYLSRDQFLDLQTDRYLGYTEHTGQLLAGQNYSVNKTLALPNDLSGPFYVFVLADSQYRVFEGTNDGNNATPSTQPLIIELPPPADLQVSTITLPPNAKSGDSVRFSWTVSNLGDNPAQGTWTDAAYLSTDAIWDINDRPVGRVTHSGTLGTGESYTSTLDATLPPATPGQYRLIVRPDIFNQVYEAEDEANNRTASASTLNVTVEELQLGVPLQTTLNTGQERLYQVNVGIGQTLKVKVNSAATTAANEVFVRFNNAPTGIVYDAAYTGLLGPNQSAVIASTQPGTYYVLVRGYSEPTNNTPVTLLADVLPFGITDVITDQGGDSRYVTTNILGAQFNQNAIVKLVRPGIAEVAPVRYQVVDSTKITAIFDFTDVPHGLYDVKVINPNGQESIVPYRYLVERAIEPDVTVGLGGPRVLAPGDTGTYGVSVKSLTNLDTPYVNFQFGIPELGTNSEVFGLPYVVFSSNLRGSPEGSNTDVPWASLVSDTNQNGEILAPGYIFDLPTAGFAGQTFNVQTYPGLLEKLKQDPTALDDVPDDQIAFTFHILASATALTRDEFIEQQKAEAKKLRNAILADSTASQALTVLAADINTWTNAYLAALEEAGFLRPENQAPPIRQNPLVVSLLSTLATGILLGPVGEQVISNGNLISFFEKIRQWYGDKPGQTGVASPPDAKQFDLGLSKPTHYQAFNVYVPFGEAAEDLPPAVPIPPPSFASFFNATGTVSNLANLTGPLGYGNENFIPTDTKLPYTIRFENAATASSSVSEVRIVTQLDEDLDPRNFQLGDLRIGDIQLHIPQGRGAFQGDFDFTRTKGFILRVSAGLDPLSNTATWLLQAIDPNSGEVLTNPNIGLLPPNTANGAGTGFVTYSVLPKDGLATGTQITAQARVFYNTAAPIDTTTISSIIDGKAPTSTVTVTPLGAGSSNYEVKWTSTDDEEGSGVKYATVYVAKDGGDFKIWKQQTTDTSGVYAGEAGHTYEFLVLATDNAGNTEKPGLGIAAPDDGGAVNLGSLPTSDESTQPDLGTLPPPSPTPSTNSLFIEAKENIPAAVPATRASEFDLVLRPFSASAFATGIPTSHANIAPLAFVTLADGSVIASGGANRGSLYRFSETGGPAGNPLSTLKYPIFDLALDREGSLWATTGGGPLVKLDVQSGQILQEYGDGLTQALAIDSQSGLIYVSSGDGIEIFNSISGTFTHYSDLRVDSLAFAPDGKLWATTWPSRGNIVRFDATGKPQRMLQYDSPVDSIAFGTEGTRLAGLLFVSNNNGELKMVDLATLEAITVASGGTRGENIKTTADGRVLLSQSGQIDVLNPLSAPLVVSTNPPPDAVVPLPQGNITITFDQDMYVGTATDSASVLNPANYQLISAGSTITPRSVQYDPATRSVLLSFNTLIPGAYELRVDDNLQSAAGITLSQDYRENFTAISDFLPYIDLQFSNPRLDRQNQTVSYDITITSHADYDLLLPLKLLLEPPTSFTGQPLDGVKTTNGGYLIDLSSSLPDGRLKPGQSITNRTITVYDPDALRIEFATSLYALPYPNQAPVITSNPLTRATVGEAYSYQVVANDPDGNTFSYLLNNAPSGMTIDANTGLITWLPTASSLASNKVDLQVYDGRGASATQSFTIELTGGNRQPVFTPIPQEIRGAEGQPFTLTLNATDPDNNRLNFWINNLPPGATFNPQTRLFSWTPGYDAAGTYKDVEFVVSDGLTQVIQTTTFLIAPTNQEPNLIKPAERTVLEGDNVRIQLQGRDAEGATLTYSSNILPGGATINPNTGVFEWTPTFFQAGEYNIPFTVSDGETTHTETTKITVLNVNAAPVFDNLGVWQIQEGQQVRFRAFAFDADNPGFVPQERNNEGTLTILEGSDPTVTYIASNLPTGASFDPETAIFSWTPGFTSAGTYNVTFTATDNGDNTGVNASSTVTVPITVFNTNRPPEIVELGNKTLNSGQILEIPISATDADSDPITLTAKGLPGFEIPSFATFIDNGDGTGLLRLTPTADDGGNYTITLTATDNRNGGPTIQSDTYSFVVSVNAPNAPPHLNYIGDQVAVVGELLELLVQGNDRNQENLSFSSVGLPSGATLTPTSVYGQARFSWTPTNADIGTHPVTIRLTDGGNGDPNQILTDELTFNLVTRTSNQTPVLTPVGNKTVNEGQTLTINLSAIDGDGDKLTYSATNLPNGAILDAKLGKLTFAPNFSSAGIYSGIVLKASDGNRSTTETISITVNNVNQAPVIAPLPIQPGQENTELSFNLAAGDLDNDPLVYSVISALPTGASFDPRTGKFTWKPGYSQAGDYVLTFKVTDPTGAIDTQDVALKIANVNRTPMIAVSSHGVALAEKLEFFVNGTDPDSGTLLTYGIDKLPQGATLDATTGKFSWTPNAGQTGRLCG
ncbi:CARDB domain-containing protein [Gloeothece verrucosa]|uniref:APHP domain protein n=1 Tax=Gloeothece verrucosa (strain PCC 7822) TaxID=497965 RepID=E0ULQ3_GLOV7|nr:CARDB domain-containing protein [Gloeothece verrucosa]ADN17883.1 APHP domain protein [Gloeothece verrucosa PCC 7822]